MFTLLTNINYQKDLEPNVLPNIHCFPYRDTRFTYKIWRVDWPKDAQKFCASYLKKNNNPGENIKYHNFLSKTIKIIP